MIRGAGGDVLADHAPAGTGVGHHVRLKLIVPLGILLGLIAGYTTSALNDLPPDSGAPSPAVTIQAPSTTIPRPVSTVPVPEVPTATSQPTPAPTPDHNALYRTDLHIATVTCLLPKMGTTNRQLEEWVQASVTCLDNAWQPVLASARWPFSRPASGDSAGSLPTRRVRMLTPPPTTATRTRSSRSPQTVSSTTSWMPIGGARSS